MNKTPYTQKDFAWVKWTPQQIENIGKEALLHKKAAHKKIKAILPEKRTYENTVYGLTHSFGGYDTLLSFTGLLLEASPNKEVRDACQAMLMSVSHQLVDIEYDRDIYLSLVEYNEGNFVDEKKSLRKEDVKLFTEMVRDYKRMGFDLPTKEQKRLKVLLKKLSKLGNVFDKNINEYEDYVLCSPEELEGLPENIIASFPKDGTTGKYKVTLQYPHFIPFMESSSSREKRKELAWKELQKGGKQNVKILSEMVDTRASISTLLGYKHHADFKTEDRMAKSAEAVIKMHDELIKKVSVLAKKDIEQLQAHAKTLGIPKLEYYDIKYVTNDLKSKFFGVDQELVREYFPLEHVTNEMFKLFGGLFAMKIKEVEIKLWHKDVKMYEVKNNDGSLVGYFALDLFPREGKYGHACAVNLIQGYEKDFKSGNLITPFSVILCNFPTSIKRGKTVVPSMVSVRDVETLFHEFGHCLHGVLSLSVHSSQSGTSVARDFVEMPSQIMENWVWNDTMLTKLSKHYKTGKKLPKDTRDKILSAKDFQKGYTYMRQLIFLKLDMDIHMGKVKNHQKAYRDLVSKYMLVTLPEKETLFPAGLGHMNGYDAGYYGYLWSLVYAQDAFAEFEEKGLFNKELGMKWRREVLEKGSSEDEMKLIQNFLGRKPNNKAFLKEVIGK